MYVRYSKFMLVQTGDPPSIMLPDSCCVLNDENLKATEKYIGVDDFVSKGNPRPVYVPESYVEHSACKRGTGDETAINEKVSSYVRTSAQEYNRGVF